MPRAADTPETVSPWAHGTVTVARAQECTPFSRQELFALMAAGKVKYLAKGGRKTRHLSWRDLERLIAELADGN